MHSVSAAAQVRLCWHPPKPAESASVHNSFPWQDFFLYPESAVLEQHRTSCGSSSGAHFSVSVAAVLPLTTSWHDAAAHNNTVIHGDLGRLGVIT